MWVLRGSDLRSELIYKHFDVRSASMSRLHGKVFPPKWLRTMSGEDPRPRRAHSEAKNCRLRGLNLRKSRVKHAL